MPAGELECAFDRLGSAVRKEDFLRSRAGRDLGEPFRQVDLRAIVEVRAAHVEQRVGLVLDGRDDLGMAVSGGVDRDPGREVEEQVAVHIFDHGTGTASHDQRIDSRVGTGNELGIAREKALGRRAGQGRAKLRNGAVVEVEEAHAAPPEGLKPGFCFGNRVSLCVKKPGFQSRNRVSSQVRSASLIGRTAIC